MNIFVGDIADAVHYHKYITNNVNILDIFCWRYRWRSTLSQINNITKNVNIYWIYFVNNITILIYLIYFVGDIADAVHYHKYIINNVNILDIFVGYIADTVHYHKYITNNVNILDIFCWRYRWRSTFTNILQTMLLYWIYFVYILYVRLYYFTLRVIVNFGHIVIYNFKLHIADAVHYYQTRSQWNDYIYDYVLCVQYIYICILRVIYFIYVYIVLL